MLGGKKQFNLQNESLHSSKKYFKINITNTEKVEWILASVFTRSKSKHYPELYCRWCSAVLCLYVGGDVGFGLVWCLVWFGLVCCLVWFVIWFGLVWFGVCCLLKEKQIRNKSALTLTNYVNQNKSHTALISVNSTKTNLHTKLKSENSPKTVQLRILKTGNTTKTNQRKSQKIANTTKTNLHTKLQTTRTTKTNFIHH